MKSILPMKTVPATSQAPYRMRETTIKTDKVPALPVKTI